MARMPDFPETRWSVIARAHAGDSTVRRRALEDFCRSYWIPLYSFARSKGKSPHDAEDLVQSFVANLMEREGVFERLDPDKGKLRAWLRTSFGHYMIEDWKRGQRLKRGGGAEFLPLDVEGVERRIEDSLQSGIGPDQAFDQHWARTILSRARRALRERHEEAGKAEEFEALLPHMEADPDETSQQLGDRLGKSASAVRMAIKRLRMDYQMAVRREIADTLAPGSDVEEELKYLLSCL